MVDQELRTFFTPNFIDYKRRCKIRAPSLQHGGSFVMHAWLLSSHMVRPIKKIRKISIIGRL